MINEKILRNEEKIILELRSLYGKYGYLPLRMSKFEEYELFARNKDFLASDQVITFNDTNGKLMALRPDVTLSIVESGDDIPGYKQKLYYNESIYRTAGNSRHFREIMQAGLECIGDIDVYDILEVIYMAAKTLELISDEYVLDISHLGLWRALLDETSYNPAFRKAASSCIAEKNVHDLRRVCREYGLTDRQTERLCSFIGIYGDLKTVLAKLEPICESEAYMMALEELKSTCYLIQELDCNDRINCDFSIVNNMNYYNGIVFRGFINGIYEGVLSGGQYDNLMKKMGRTSGGLGFALYLDSLDDIIGCREDNVVDILLLYDGETANSKVAEKTRSLVSEGKSVSAQKTVPEKLKYREIVDLRKGASND